MAKKRRSRPRENESAERPARIRPLRRGRRLMRRLVILLVLAIAVAAALPTIIANTGVRDTLLGWSMPNSGWAVTSQSAKLSWTGSQSIEGIRIVDPQGREFFTCQSAALERSLLSLVTDRRDLGRLLIQSPELYMVTRTDGSNVEDLAQDLSQQQSEPKVDASSTGQAPIALELELVDGIVHGEDQPTGEKWSLHGAQIVARLADLTSGGVTARCTGELSYADRAKQGGLELRVEQTGRQQFKVNLITDALSLHLLKPFLSRQLSQLRLQGEISTDAQILVGYDDHSDLRVQSTGRLEARQLSISPGVQDVEDVRFASLSVPWEMSLAGNQLQIQRFSMESDWTRLAAQGAIDLSEISSIGIDNLPQASGSVSGVVQLHRLAVMLPKTLHLREGVRINSGQLEFSSEAKPKAEGVAWTAAVAVFDLIGNDGRRQIRWDEPVELSLSVFDAATGPQVGKVSLSAPFADASFEPSGDRVNGSFQFDLEQLADETEKFVDLDGWSFQGRGEGTFSFVPGDDEQFLASTEVKLSELNVAQRQQLVWAEPKLQITANAKGSLENLAPSKLASAELHLRGARDRLDAELLQPVSLNEEAQPWKVALEATGPLASWAGRLRPWIEAVPEQLEGEARVQATALATPSFIHLLESSASVSNLHVRQGPMQIDESRVEFAGDIRIDPATGSVASEDATFQSSTVTFRSQGVNVQLAGQEIPKAQGLVAFRADLERLSAAAGWIKTRDAIWARGTAAGNLRLASNGERLTAELQSEVENLAVMKSASPGNRGDQPQVAWSEPKLKSEGKLLYDPVNDRLTLEKLSLVGNTLRVDASSGIDQLRTVGDLNASGTLQYDSQALAKLLATYLGPGVQLQGDRVMRFQMNGKLYGSEGLAAHWSNQWNGSAEVGWTSGNVFGLAVGNGKLAGALRDGRLQIAPLDVMVGEGRITARPVASLSPGAEQIELPRGPLISNVAISQEVSDAMLKYVAPVVAGATRTEGRFSLQLEEAKVPLLAPERSRALGKLDIHDLRVTPGPLMRDIASIVGQLEAVAEKRNFLRAATRANDVKLLSMSDRQIEFQVVDGRVYHRSLEFLVDDVPVKSTGSVGFDQTLAIDIEVPIQQKWLGDKRAFQSLAGQTLRIPVRGTFKDPKVDGRAVADLSRKLLQGAANQVLGDELNRAFDKLFQ